MYRIKRTTAEFSLSSRIKNAAKYIRDRATTDTAKVVTTKNSLLGKAKRYIAKRKANDTKLLQSFGIDVGKNYALNMVKQAGIGGNTSALTKAVASSVKLPPKWVEVINQGKVRVDNLRNRLDSITVKAKRSNNNPLNLLTGSTSKGGNKKGRRRMAENSSNNLGRNLAIGGVGLAGVGGAYYGITNNKKKRRKPLSSYLKIK